MLANLIVCTALGLWSNGEVPGRTDSVEYELNKWKPPVALHPPKNLRESPEGIEGVWRSSTGWTSTEFLILRRDEGQYVVQAATSGCLGGSCFRRSATFKDGQLRLNRPIAPYAGEPYDRLFLVNDGKTPRLIPSTAYVDEEVSLLVIRMEGLSKGGV